MGYWIPYWDSQNKFGFGDAIRTEESKLLMSLGCPWSL